MRSRWACFAPTGMTPEGSSVLETEVPLGGSFSSKTRGRKSALLLASGRPLDKPGSSCARPAPPAPACRCCRFVLDSLRFESAPPFSPPPTPRPRRLRAGFPLGIASCRPHIMWQSGPFVPLGPICYCARPRTTARPLMAPYADVLGHTPPHDPWPHMLLRRATYRIASKTHILKAGSTPRPLGRRPALPVMPHCAHCVPGGRPRHGPTFAAIDTSRSRAGAAQTRTCIPFRALS